MVIGEDDSVPLSGAGVSKPHSFGLVPPRPTRGLDVEGLVCQTTTADTTNTHFSTACHAAAPVYIYIYMLGPART